MSLELPLQVVFVVEDDSLVGDWHEYLFAGFISEVVHSIENVIVEAKGPLQSESTGLPQILVFPVVLFALHKISYNISN